MPTTRKFNMAGILHRLPAMALVVLVALAGAGCTAKMKAAYHKHRADRYYASGQFDQAEIEYKNVLRQAPESAEAWSRLGLIYFDQGRVREAVPVLARAAQLDTNNLQVRITLGGIYLDAGKALEARAQADYVLQKDPRNLQAPLLLALSAATTNEMTEIRRRLKDGLRSGETAGLDAALGVLSFRQGDYNEAETSLRDAVKLDPKFYEAYAVLGDVALARREVKEADQAFQKAADLAPLRSGKVLQYAQFKTFMGDLDSARNLLQDAVKRAPDYLPAWIALARLAGATKDYEGGIKLLGNVLARDPRNSEALLLKGSLELDQGEPAKAVKEFEAVVRYYPALPAGYYQLAKALAALDDFEQATANVNQALKLSPNFTDAAMLLAEIQIYTDDPDPAIASLKRLLGQRPEFVAARLLLARAFISKSQIDSAVQIYRELETAFPSNPQFPLLIGNALLRQKKPLEARSEFDHALKLAPDFLPALEQEVKLDLLEKQFDSAQQQVEAQLAKNPTAEALQLLLAQVQIARGETNQAEGTLKKIITSHPESRPAYLMLAQLYAAARENQKALADLSAVLAKNPEDSRALLLLGISYAAEKNYTGARDAYEKLLGIAPKNVVALNNLACLYSENLGQPQKAYQLARSARDIQPADPFTADTLGWILAQQGQYSRAVNLLRESAFKLDADPAVQFHLSKVYYLMGDEANSLMAFQRTLQLSQDFPEADECRRCMRVLAIDPANPGASDPAWLEEQAASEPGDVIVHLRLAAIREREGAVEKAADAYESALQASPQNVTALVNLARLRAARDPQEAFKLAKTAYKIEPNNPLVTRTLGRLAFQTGDYAWSVNLLKLAARDQPQDPEVTFDLGEALYSVGLVADARTALQKSLQAGTGFTRSEAARQMLALTDPTDDPAQMAAAALQAAEILKSSPDYVPAIMVQAAVAEKKGDWAAAVRNYEAVLYHYPDFAPAQKRLASLYVTDPKNDAKAYPLAVKARQAFPGDPQVARDLGVLVCRQGDYGRAAGLLAEGARQLKQDAVLMYYLGLAQFQLKNHIQARNALQKALDLNLSGTQAAEARRMLAELK